LSPRATLAAFVAAPAAKLNKKVAEINAIIANLGDGKTVFYKDNRQGVPGPQWRPVGQDHA
jgi:hypothetical protein